MPVVYINIDKSVRVVSPQPQRISTSTSPTPTTSAEGIEIVGYEGPEVIVISDTDEQESGRDQAIELTPSSTPQVDRPLSPVSPPHTPTESINIVPLDGTNDDPLPTISPPVDERKKIPFDMCPYRGMIPQVVNKVPWDINGLKSYIMKSVKGNIFATSIEMEVFCHEYFQEERIPWR